MQPELMLMDANDENKTPDIPYDHAKVPVLAELLCSETSDHELIDSVPAQSVEQCEDSAVMSYFDTALLHHPEIMTRLKFLESKTETPKSYFLEDDKSEILPYMRKVVASWMLEVCEEQRCDEAVFPLAVALLDQFLSECLIRKEQLQLVACVCLLLASKTRQCNHFSLELLSWYTDNSVSPQSLRVWEMGILSKLNWDVNIITAIDFVDVILVRSVCDPYKPQKHSNVIRRHAITFIALCSTEPRFVGLKPSLVAAASIYAAVRGLKLHDSQLASCLSDMASVSETQLLAISTSIEQVIASEIKVMEQQGMDSSIIRDVGVLTTSQKNSCTPNVSNTSSAQISEEVLV